MAIFIWSILEASSNEGYIFICISSVLELSCFSSYFYSFIFTLVNMMTKFIIGLVFKVLNHNTFFFSFNFKRQAIIDGSTILKEADHEFMQHFFWYSFLHLRWTSYWACLNKEKFNLMSIEWLHVMQPSWLLLLEPYVVF